MKKFQITAGILTAVCLIFIGIFTLVQNSLGSRLDSQLVCERWAADGTRYAQLSAFLSPNAGIDEDSVKYQMTQSIDAALVEASVSAANDNARIYSYSYSGEGTVTLSKLNEETGKTAKSGVRATALGVGADFFTFHPIKLLSGNYINTGDTVLNDTIIIDNDLAWQFFGSPDVVGKRLQISGQDFYIVGVCEADPDYAEFYGEYPRIYMSYSKLAELNSSMSITCVETCMPDPVKDFAKDILEKSLSADEQYIEIVENSSRFTDSGLMSGLKNFSRRSVRTKLVAYPYWENAAVILVDRAAILYVGKLIPIIIIVVLAVIEIIIGYTKRKKFFNFIGGKVSGWWDKFEQDRRRKARAKIEAKANAKLEAAKVAALKEPDTGAVKEIPSPESEKIGK